MTNTNLHHAPDDIDDIDDVDDDEIVPELDRATVDRLIDSIRSELHGGTFGSMDGDSAASWIVDRLGHLLEHPEDV